MSKLQIIRYSYYFLMVCWILQAMLGGLNQYLIIPSICLVLCYVLMKKVREEAGQIDGDVGSGLCWLMS